MDRRQRNELDRHITGNYGADQERRHTSSRDDGGDALARPAEGSYNYYRQYGGGFVNAFLDAIHVADARNRQRLALAFPQLVAAWELWYNNNERDGDCAPEGFAPDPFAVADADVATGRLIAAPTLLAALEKVVGYAMSDWRRCDLCDGYEGHDEDCPIPAARAAIKKAQAE